MSLISDERLYGHIGMRIRDARGRAHPKVSQAKLAAMLGLERTSITNIENGNQRPSILLIYEICSILNLSVSELLPPVFEVIAKRQERDVDSEVGQPLARSTAERLKEELKRR